MASSSKHQPRLVASARAISRRLRPGVPRLRAGAVGAPSGRVERSRRACARGRSRAWGWRRNAPTITLSSTVMSSKVGGTWNVRRDAAARAFLGRQRGHVLALERNRAGGRHDVAGEAVEECRLAGAVRADQAEISPDATARSASDHRAEAAERLGDPCASSSIAASRLAAALAARRDRMSAHRTGADAAGLESARSPR